MTKQEVNKLVAEYIVAISPAGAPSSIVWIAVDSQMRDVHRHQLILATLVDAGLVKVSNHFCTLTEKGLNLHKKIEHIFTEKPLPVTVDPSMPI